MLKWLFTLTCLVMGHVALAQQVHGEVNNKQTQEPLPFATVYNTTQKQGTIANDRGEFVLPNTQLGDTLLVSFIGFKPTQVIVNAFDVTVLLPPQVQQLNQFIVAAENTYLYHMISQCKASKAKHQDVRAYYALQSRINQQKVEVLEAYYNAFFDGYEVVDLQMKNGRLALAPFGNRFFTMSEGGQAMTNHTLFPQNYMFPKSPMGMSAKKMRKRYSLSVAHRYVEKQHVIYAIDFSPTDTSGAYFYGTIWLDSNTHTVQKITLEVTHAAVYPFDKVGNTQSIQNVDMRMHKTFALVNGEPTIESVAFDYDITYHTLQDLTFTANTQAVLYAYNYDQGFLLPQFHFSEGMYEDYRKINAIPYNPWFWENINEFTTPIMQENSAFVNDTNTITGETLFQKNKYFKTGYFEHPYIWWSADKRITFRTDTYKPSEVELNSMVTEKYHLLAQIMLDVNRFNDSTQVFTHTIYDPYESYYYYAFSKTGVAFLNMYFDLVEIHKRQLDQEIYGLTDPNAILTTYQRRKALMEAETNLFFKEVQHGTQRKKMEEWNARIQHEIGIDNLTFFRVYEED